MPVTGGRLHYLEAGPPDGRARGTVVLLHGASANAADPMLALGGRLADRYRVLAFDRPGHGWSDRIPGAEAASPARQATAIAEALRRLDVAKAVVVGHSYAGSLLPHLALDHPDVTGAILIVAGVTHPWPGEAISWYYTSAASALGWLFTRTLTAPLGSVLIGPTVKTVFAPQAAPAAYAEKAQIALVLRPPVFRANATTSPRCIRPSPRNRRATATSASPRRSSAATGTPSSRRTCTAAPSPARSPERSSSSCRAPGTCRTTPMRRRSRRRSRPSRSGCGEAPPQR